MQKNDLYKCNDALVRILAIDDERVLLIDCVKPAMPRWSSANSLKGWERCAEGEYPIPDAWRLKPQEEIMTEQRKLMHERYTLIAPVLPFIHKESMRSVIIQQISEMNGVSKQTVRKYLCLYLASQKIESLAPGSLCTEKPLTPDEKNYRWALNRYFYTQRRHSLTTTYMLLLKDRYTDATGQLVEGYPPFHRFRYYYQKTRKLRREIADRESYTAYLRNHRPLLGDGVQEMAPNVGVGMLDATVCDLYLVDDAGCLVGRPVLTACVDAFSGMCCGYSLSWEGGVYSLRGLMLNTIADKVQWCREHGVFIEPEQWPTCSLPGVMLTDMGSEYKSDTFAQIAELGVKVTNLPPARPDLKSRVEKFFDVIQQLYKNHLKWKGVVEPDYQERGARDYRLDATLTLQEFERVLLHCIVYYNFRLIAENHPYTEPMLEEGVKPNASSIFAWGLTQPGANFIGVTPEQVIMTLLPRTKARFTRKGLIVNGIRYRNDAYTEQYLRGADAIASYNPDDVTQVWLREKNGEYIPFQLIERRFSGKSLDGVKQMQTTQSELVRSAAADNLQAQIDLAQHIEVIANKQPGSVGVKNIRQSRQRARTQAHIDYVKEVHFANKETHSAKKEVTNRE